MVMLENEDYHEGDILKALMKEFGVGVKDLARMMDQAEITIIRMRKEKLIRMDKLIEACKVIGVSSPAKWFPRLKDNNRIYEEKTEIMHKVEDIETAYERTKEDVAFLKQRMTDYDDLIEAKDAVISQQKQTIEDLRKQLEDFKKK